MAWRNRYTGEEGPKPAWRNPARALSSALLVVLILLVPSPGSAQQQETSLFRLTDVAGRVRIGYQFADYNSGAGSNETRGTWEEQLSLNTQGFVYHPALLEFDLGGGPLLLQQQLDTPNGSAGDNEVLWGGNLGMSFLKYKPYPFKVYLRRSHPSVTTGLAGRYLTEQREHGISGTVREGFLPLVPTDVAWSFLNRQQTGSGFGTQLDEQVSEARLRGANVYRQRDKFSFDLRSESRLSSSGSLGLPVSESETNTLNARISNNNYFGATDLVSLGQSLSLLSQSRAGAFPVDTLRYNANARWRATDGLQFTSDLSLGETDREGYGVSTAGDLALGVNGSLGGNRGLGYHGRLAASNQEEPRFSREQREAEGGLSYSRSFSFGQVRFNGILLASDTDQRTADDFVRVFDEPVVLSGTVPVDLRYGYVDLVSVVVTNVPGSQVFVEGLDYRLVTVGSVTAIERFVGGNILDGQTVLVSYQYQAGGTVTYDMMGASLGVSATVFERLQLFVRHNSVEYELTDGLPSTPLNNRTILETGGSLAAFKFRYASLGGDFRLRDQQEDISPHRGERFSVFLDAPLPWALNLRLSTGLDRTDFENSDEDVDLRNYQLSLGGDMRGYGRIQYNATLSNNIGGSVPRENVSHSLRYNWQYRQVRVVADLLRSQETMGATRRESTSISIQLTRVF